MNILFRADASLKIGTGHVTRCLALADALKARGAICHFVCRNLEGHLGQWIEDSGHIIHLLPGKAEFHPQPVTLDSTLAHHDWLEGSWQDDAAQTEDLAAKLQPSWIIVDHYALDARWEVAVKPAAARLLVIDDLTDRPHLCDILLNQNLGADPSLYAHLVPPYTKLLIGPRYALLRAGFAKARKALGPPENRPINNRWLACVGGTDPHNTLGKIVQAWKQVPDPKPKLDLALRSNSPNVASLNQAILDSNIELHLDADIIKLMIQADLIICSAGSISWERCCLGLPAIVGTVAENQYSIFKALIKARTGIGVERWQDVSVDLLADLLIKILRRVTLTKFISKRCARILDCDGTETLAIAILGDLSENNTTL